MANIKRTQLSGKLLEIYDKIQLQKESDNVETVKRAKIAEKKFEDKIAELKDKKERLAKDGKLDAEKKQTKVSLISDTSIKSKTTTTPKVKKEHISTRAKKLAKEEGISFNEARIKLSKEIKKENKNEVQQAQKELDALLKLARKSSIDDVEYTPRVGKTASKPKAGKTISKSSDGMRQAKPKGKRISKSGKVYYEYRENRSDENSLPTKTGYKYKGNTPPYLEKGGRVISVVNQGEEFNKEKYEAIFGDYDGDGVANIDDISPLDSTKSGKVEQVELQETFEKLINIKNQLDSKMYAALDELDKKAPKNAELYARTKTPYSIVKKLVDKRLLNPTKGLTDIIGTTIAVDNHKDLEKVKKDIQNGSMGKVLDFDDFYKNPNNGYRAYHFIVEYEGTPMEVQLKTKMQKKLNEVSHQFYKDGTLNAKGLDEVSKMVMDADKGDNKAMENVEKLIADKESLKKKLSISKMAVGGRLLTTRERYIDELKGLTGLSLVVINNFVRKNDLSDNEILNLVVGLGRKQISNKDVVLTIKGETDNAQTKKIFMFLKSDKAFRKYADGGTLTTPFGQSGLVGETGTLNEMELFAMGGDLPQGVHQFYGQTYNPAYPTPYGYKYGGTLEMQFEDGGSLGTMGSQTDLSSNSLDAITFEKGGFIPNEIIEAVKNSNNLMQVGENLDQKGIKYSFSFNDAPMPPAMYRIKHGDKNIYILNKDYVDGADFLNGEIAVGIMAKGGQTEKRPKSAIMRDRKYINMNEKWETDYAKKTGQLDTRKRYKKRKELGGEVSKTKKQTPMSLAKEIRKDDEKWQDAIQRATKILNDKK